MEGMYEGFGSPISVPQAPKKGGMFGAGKGNIGEAIAAALAGFTAARGNPAGAFALQMLNQRRQARDEQAQYGQHREDEFQDWVRKQAYQAEHPNPINNDTVADYDFISQRLGGDAANEYLRNKTIAPPMMVPGPNGQMFMVPRAMPQQQGGPQAGHVEDGFQFMGGDPSDQRNWKPAGDPTPQASGGFPGSR
jgi:hypothetical protein